MIGYTVSHCSITGLRLHDALLFLKVANPSASTVNTYKYYDCSCRYEHKRDYEESATTENVVTGSVNVINITLYTVRPTSIPAQSIIM